MNSTNSPHSISLRVTGRRIEEALADLLYDPAARARLRAGAAPDPLLSALDLDELDEIAAMVRDMVIGRAHRGTGGPSDWYPQTFAAWRATHAHADDPRWLDELVTRFCSSRECAAWRDTLGGEIGLSLEEAWFRFFDARDVGSAAVREEEFLHALVRGLAVSPSARFTRPAPVRPAPGGSFAVSSAGVLHAAVDGKYMSGPITPLVAAILAGESPDEIAKRASLPLVEIERVRQALRDMRLVA